MQCCRTLSGARATPQRTWGNCSAVTLALVLVAPEPLQNPQRILPPPPHFYLQQQPRTDGTWGFPFLSPFIQSVQLGCRRHSVPLGNNFSARTTTLCQNSERSRHFPLSTVPLSSHSSALATRQRTCRQGDWYCSYTLEGILEWYIRGAAGNQEAPRNTQDWHHQPQNVTLVNASDAEYLNYHESMLNRPCLLHLLPTCRLGQGPLDPRSHLLGHSTLHRTCRRPGTPQSPTFTRVRLRPLGMRFHRHHSGSTTKGDMGCNAKAESGNTTLFG